MPTQEEVTTPVENNDDEFAIAPQGDVPEEAEAPEEQEVTIEEEMDTENEEETTATDDQPEQPSEDDAVEIDGKTYSPEELDNILRLGAQNYEYQKTHPGVTLEALHKGFTQKTMEIAEEKRTARELPDDDETVVVKNEPAAESPDTENLLEGVNEEDVNLIEKVVRAKGFMTRSEFEAEQQKRSSQTSKARRKEATQEFLKNYPQYSADKDPTGARWNKLMSEYKLFDKSVRQDPDRVSELLERAHRQIDSSPPSALEKAKKLAQKKQNALGATRSDGGGGSESSTQEAPKAVPQGVRQFLKGFKPEELANISEKIKNN